jgi:hypothetical protein
MKRGAILFIFLISIIFILPFVIATEEQQVEKAYSCLDTRINQTNCSTGFSFEDKVFSLLATGNIKCQNEVISQNLSTLTSVCWPKSGCDIKSTAQAVLALDENGMNITKAENWLLTQTAVPANMDWFLEIESSVATSCNIIYSSESYKILIGEDKKISSNAGTSLVRAQDNYWLQISPQIYNKNISISCDKPFITTLLFKKKDSSTVHVSETVHSSSGGTGSKTTETVDSFCFSNGGVCNYEGSLWSALVLYSLGQDVTKFMPYLITMMDESSNQIYIPESFLYFLTGKFRTELLLKQNGLYWEILGTKYNRYYDTAFALLPLFENGLFEKDNSISWLLDVQQTAGASAGCWNNGNIRDTAFILYSIWPKHPSIPGRCSSNLDCPAVSCKDSSCGDNGECVYEPFTCQDGDGCCNPGCTILTDDDCSPGENQCKTVLDCNKYVLPTEDKYCSDDLTESWKDDTKWACENKVCVIDRTPKKIETCNDTSECYSGSCLGTGNIDECTDYTDCYGEDCVNGECVPYSCTSNIQCTLEGESCINGECRSSTSLDCSDNNGYCMSQTSCVDNGGSVLDSFSCLSSLSVCCDAQPDLGKCVDDNGGIICSENQACVSGNTQDASDTLSGETCCVGGSCEDIVSTSICGTDNNGICRSSCASDEEATTFFTCDSTSDSCCVVKQTSTSYLWVWILLGLIVLVGLGILFRDKLRAQWIRLKTSFGKKDDRKKFEMPMSSHSIGQPRMFSRGILPPQSRPPMRGPISSQHPLPHRKPEEKPKNELDDVLKKLKEMGK